MAALGAVWVSNDGAGTLARVDPRTNRVTLRIRLRPGLFSLARGFGALWAVNYEEGTLTRVDPQTRCRRTVRVGAAPFDVLAACARGSRSAGRSRREPWPGTGRSGCRTRSRTSCTRVDPKTPSVVDSFPAGPGAFFALRAFGSMWVVSYAGDGVRRYRDP